MFGVNYKRARVSTDLALVREELGNKTSDRTPMINLWMSNIYNYKL